MKKVLSLLLTLCVLCSLFSGCSSKGSGDYTVMVYMAGTNSNAYNTTYCKDIKEMLSSGIDVAKANILINAGYPSDGKKSATYIINNEGKKPQLKLLEKSGKKVGDSAALTDFLNYARQNYSASHFAFIYLDRMSNSLLGFKNDKDNSASLTPAKIAKALDSAEFTADNKIDFSYITL